MAFFLGPRALQIEPPAENAPLAGSPSVLPVCMIIILDFMVMMGYATLLPSWVSQYSDSPAALAYVMTASNTAMVIGIFVLGRSDIFSQPQLETEQWKYYFSCDCFEALGSP